MSYFLNTLYAKKRSSEGGVIASPADLFLIFSKQDSNLVEPKKRMEEEPLGEGKKGVKWSKDLESVQPIPNRKEEKRVQHLHKETKPIPVPLGEEVRQCYFGAAVT